MNLQPAMLQQAVDLRGMSQQDSDEFEAWLATKGMTWRGIDSGAYDVTLKQSLLMWTVSDPVRWCETFLTDQRTGRPYRLFDYQRESMRAWNQDTVHQCGAEVGKTREIICLLLWGAYTSMGFTVDRPWFLVGAPQQTHLDEILMAVEEQVGAASDGSATGSLLSGDWLKPKRTPHTMHRIRCPNMAQPHKLGVARIYYRPAGHDGEAFRGVHVHGMAMLDEAAKLKSKLHFSEFYRALEPGCKARVYSVPDGDNASDYYKLTQRAVPGLPAETPGVRLFKWAKTLMPAPYWSAERDAEFVRRFGGRHTPGYLRNVLGEHGQAENPVWPWEVLLPNVADLPAYRIIRLHADNQQQTLSIEMARIELTINGTRKVGAEQIVEQSHVELSPYIDPENDAALRAVWQQLLADRISGDERGVFYAGADLGESNDPTEIVLSEQRGAKLQDCLRIHCKGLPYHAQRELIFALHGLYAQLLHWGVDLGNAGSMVVKDLQTMEAYDAARFDETMTGFHFSNSVDCLGEDGEPLLARSSKGDTDTTADGEDKAQRAPAKHWATVCITRRLQVRGYAMAYDAEALNAMSNQTSREGAKHVIYSKKDDHIPDARRQQMLRLLYDDTGGAVDVFASGSFERRAA